MGGAAYIELFSGPGRSFVEDDKAFIDGSPLVDDPLVRRVAIVGDPKDHSTRSLFDSIRKAAHD